LKSIEILINPQGEVTLQTKGYAGSSCKAATKALEEALGLKGREKLTAEFYQAQNTSSRQQLRQ
jgi:Protein of unknown function (DUF2997)